MFDDYSIEEARQDDREEAGDQQYKYLLVSHPSCYDELHPGCPDCDLAFENNEENEDENDGTSRFFSKARCD